MNDIARLSAVLDTSSVDKGIASLKKLTPAAKSAEAATERFNAAAAGVTPAAGGAAGTIKSFSAAASGAAGATDKVSRAALASGSAMKTVQTAAAGASASMGNLVATTARVGTTFVQAGRSCTGLHSVVTESSGSGRKRSIIAQSSRWSRKRQHQSPASDTR